MAIRITEDDVVIYENEPDIDRELFPNIPEGGGSPEQIAQAVADWFEDHPTVQDVQVNGASILNAQGVANVQTAADNTFGVVKVATNGFYGINYFSSSNDMYKFLVINPATNEEIKRGVIDYHPIVPMRLHIAAFYGLAKAAGDTTQSASSNAVGAYTEEAKSAIQVMLGISDIIGPIEGATASTSYSVGNVFLHSGALYKATVAIASGDAIVPGTNCEQTTIIDILKGA